VKLRIAWIGKTKEPSIQALTSKYVKRIARYVPAESSELGDESALLKQIEKSVPKPCTILLDSRGKQLSSEDLAEVIERHQDRGTQVLLFAVGPADGFSRDALELADYRLSLGKMTLAHELARVILLEQIYRAYTILKKHPYHLGH
jgi:23S rRNA (pseudouridine1915-N3)-methyltransferase